MGSMAFSVKIISIGLDLQFEKQCILFKTKFTSRLKKSYQEKLPVIVLKVKEKMLIRSCLSVYSKIIN